MLKNSLKKTPFKSCGTCDTTWITRSEFIGCRSISLIGYQSNFERIDEGLFLFNHTIESCGSTISVPVGKFADLYTGERYTEPKFGNDECQRRCVDESNLERCNEKCKYAYVREILQILRESKG